MKPKKFKKLNNNFFCSNHTKEKIHKLVWKFDPFCHLIPLHIAFFYISLKHYANLNFLKWADNFFYEICLWQDNSFYEITLTSSYFSLSIKLVKNLKDYIFFWNGWWKIWSKCIILNSIVLCLGRIVVLCKNFQTKYKTIYKHFCGIQMPNIISLYKIPSCCRVYERRECLK